MVGLIPTVTTALMRKVANDRIRSFSITFEDAEFDEQSYQDEASTFLDTQHHNVRCSSADIARIFPDVIWHTEQPVIRTAPAPLFLLSGLVRQNGFKVVLTGKERTRYSADTTFSKRRRSETSWHEARNHTGDLCC